VETAKAFGQMELFQLTIGEVPDIRLVLELLRAHYSINDEVATLMRLIAVSCTAFKEVFDAKRLKRVARAICDIKRIANKRAIKAVRISELVNIKNSKDNNQRSVLDLLVFTAIDQNKLEMLLIGAELPSLVEANRFSLESIGLEVAAFKRGVEQHKSVIAGKTGQPGVDRMEVFVAKVSVCCLRI
jgi:hypothetical protein